MKLKDARLLFQQETQGMIDDREGREIFLRLAEACSSHSRIDIFSNADIDIDETQMRKALSELKNQRPIQYITETEWFAGLPFRVNESVLIPRPETEELVNWILSYCSQQHSPNTHVLDIGTGSGCIAIALQKKNSSLLVSAMDISKAALQVAQQNAERLQATVTFLEVDILSKNADLLPQYDIIVSNPPYISQAEKQEMSARVLQYEPHSALFVTNQDPLQFYKAIATFSSTHLKPKGSVFVEVNQQFAAETKALFAEAGWDTELRKDMYGNQRMLKATKKSLPN